MSARRIILIVAALIITVGTAAVARNWVNSRPAVVQAPVAVKQSEGPMVLVAQHAIPTGVFVQPTQLRWTTWPDAVIPPTYFTKDEVTLEDLAGAVVRRGFTAGEPITKGRIIRPGDRGFLAAVLRPGFRAVAIRVNATSGISGLVFPGDRVDLILTHGVSGGDGDSRMVSETFLENVRVLAIDQYVDEADGKPRIAKNATIEITPKQAEMVSVVQEIGPISMALRSLAKDEQELEDLANLEEPVLTEPDPERGATYTFDSEVSILANPSFRKTVDVSRGNDVQQQRF
ncbi:MAG TPA: Flp pilus assembly protein CpaB [Kiloniellaceae bacterium]|nr:Flp pilus assembly protein CpaB [Kiloniellaceae bacterium]